MGESMDVLTTNQVGYSASRGDLADPMTGVESTLSEVLAQVLGVNDLSTESNFFDDLGADSMVMARFCARVRKLPDLPTVSMKDIYQHSTIRSLVAALAPSAPPATPVAQAFAKVVAGVLGVAQ